MPYLDHHAAAPLCARAIDAMQAARAEAWANPASVHAAGRRSRSWLERARREVADALGAEPTEIVLTAGGTEACNLGVRGLAARAPGPIVSTSIEHPAVGRAVEGLARSGSAVTHVDVPDGAAPEDLRQILEAHRPALLAVQWVNHETGTVLPVTAWTETARAYGTSVFVDATQALGKLPFHVRDLGADAVAVASHKMGGPAGAGALWVRAGVDVDPVLSGGAQERGRRPGTPDVVSAVGFGAACAEIPARLAAMTHVARRRDRLEAVLESEGARVNGRGGPRVATACNVSVRGWSGEVLVAALDVEGLSASSGAACSSGVQQRSPVVAAMYDDEPWRADSALRLSLGPEVGDDDVALAVQILERVLARGSNLR